MNNRYLVGVVVVVGAIFVGVSITTHRMQNPLLQRMVIQQGELLRAQQDLQRQISSSPGLGQAVPANIEQRLANLERQVAMLTGALQAVKAPAPSAAQQRPMPPSEDLTTVHDIPVDHSPILGKKDAPITLVEFIDIQCPYCGRFHPTVNEVVKAYPEQVRFVQKNFPLSFHPQAKPAAKAAFAAGEQGKYFEMMDLLLVNSQALSDEKFVELAGELGLDAEKFQADYKNNDAKYEAWIQADMELAQKIGVRGTPTYYLQGRKTVARDLENYKKEIDQILADLQKK